MAIRDDFEQDARIALLAHCTSQMQGYKVNILTVVVGFLAYVELIKGLPRFYFIFLLPLGVGVLSALVFWSVARMLWFGKHVRDLIRKPLSRSSENMLKRLDCLIHSIEWGVEPEVYYPASRVGKLIKIGGSGGRLFRYAVAIGVIVMLVMLVLMLVIVCVI